MRRNAYLWAGAEPPCVVVRWNGEKLELWVHQQDPVFAEDVAIGMAEFTHEQNNHPYPVSRRLFRGSEITPVMSPKTE